MRWWDTSALVALLSDEDATVRVKEVLAAHARVAVWWGTKAEGAFAICRLECRGSIPPAVATRVLGKLEELLSEAVEVPPSEEVRATACRALRVHDLTAADALQLAAALVWAEHRPNGRGFACLDRRLREAAAREGFGVIPDLA